ncbi:MAG: DUF695 domain-containing protein [Planctomycetes bacterium]|nr:DUF695 domain-containing protein [Planctomycetota bacterium]
MSDKWEMYFAPVDEQPAAILVDLGIGETAPDPERPMLLWMWLQMHAPDDNGFAGEDEEPELVKIEDTFIDAVELTTGAVLVGRVTTCGRREFYFYGKTAEGFEDTIAESMEEFEDYEFETGVQDDEEWLQYLEVLYPGPEDQQQIFNRQVIERLSDSGDSLVIPRAVDHFANFRSIEDRSVFVTAAVTAGYKVIDEDFDEDPDCELPYGVSLQRISPVDMDTIDEITFELFDMAREHDGEYEGWGSQVVTD